MSALSGLVSSLTISLTAVADLMRQEHRWLVVGGWWLVVGWVADLMRQEHRWVVGGIRRLALWRVETWKLEARAPQMISTGVDGPRAMFTLMFSPPPFVMPACNMYCRAASVAFITGMMSVAFIVGPTIGGRLKSKESAGRACESCVGADMGFCDKVA